MTSSITETQVVLQKKVLDAIIVVRWSGGPQYCPRWSKGGGGVHTTAQGPYMR